MKFSKQKGNYKRRNLATPKGRKKKRMKNEFPLSFAFL